VKKARGIAGGQGARVFGVDHIVRDGGDAVRCGGIGANGTEGSDDSHREPSII
jgi:hypothetical protein